MLNLNFIKNKVNHRIKGPAHIYFFNKYHYFIYKNNGKYHRENGPACAYSFGHEEYWLDGKKYSEHQYYKKIKT